MNSGGFQEGPKADCRKTPRCVAVHKSLQVRLTSEPETLPPGAPNASLIDKSNSQTRSCGTQGIKPDEAATNVSSQFNFSLRTWRTKKEEKSPAEGVGAGP